MKTIKALLFTLIILAVAVVLALLPIFFGEVGIVILFVTIFLVIFFGFLLTI